MNEFDATDVRFASPMERLLYLRSTTYMRDLRGPTLASIAQRAREVSVRAGTVLSSPAAVSREVFFIVDGEATIRVGDVIAQHITPPGGVGFLGMLGEAAHEGIATTETNCQMLAIANSDMLELLEEDYFFMGQTIRALMGAISGMQAKLESAGAWSRGEPELGERPQGKMSFVQRLRRIRVGPYERCTLDALTDMALRAEEVRYAPGDVIWREGERGDWGLNVVHGIVDCDGESPPRSFRMGADSTVGTIQAQALLPRAYTCTASTEVVALKGDIESMNDIIEDHPEFGLTILSFIADLLFGLHLRIARAGL